MKCIGQSRNILFPQGGFSIILLAGQPVGRQVVNRAATEIRLVDMALLPQYRGRGAGTRLLQDLLAEASSMDKPVCLQVLKGSRPARLISGWGSDAWERTGFMIAWSGNRWRPALRRGFERAFRLA